MNDPNQKKNNSNLDSVMQGANWGALIVMVIAVILLLFVVAKMFWKESENNAPSEIIVKYELKLDTISVNKKAISISTESVKQIDHNNKVMLDEINNSVQAQYSRMESILQVQEDRNKLFTYGAGLLAILVAIATFFGFKSINEMKRSTIDAAEYEAKKVAEKVAEKVARDVAVEKTKEEIVKRLDNIKNDLRNELFVSFKKEITRKELEVSDDFANNLRSEFDEKIAHLLENINIKEDVVEIKKESEGKKEDSTSNLKTDVQIESVSINEKDLFDDEDLTK